MWDVIVQDGKVLLRFDTFQTFEITTHSDEPEDLAWYREMLQNAMRTRYGVKVMNERIREHALQAGWSEDIRYAPRAKEIEKFAELIIKECLEQVRDEVQYQSDWKLADAVSNRVLKHFGV